MTLPGSLRRYSNFVRVWGFLWYTNVSGLGPVLIKISCITKTVAESTILISANWMWIYINVSGLGPVKVNITCADQGIFIRGGVQTWRQENSLDGKKTALTAVFFCLFVLCSSQPINRGVQWFYFREGLSYEDFSDIPMFQDWGQSTLKLHVYNKNGSWKYHFNQYKLNMNIYKCFRTWASQSKHNMCGSRNFNQRGRPDGKQTALTVFFFFVCVVLNLLTEGFQWFYFRDGLSFSRGSNFFQECGGGGGVQMLISIETNI